MVAVYSSSVTSALDALVQSAESSYESMGAGNLSRVRPVLYALESTELPVARAWAAALRMRLALASPRYGLVPPLGDLGACVDGPLALRRAAIRTTTDAVRLAVLCFDAQRIRELSELAPRLADGLEEPEIELARLCRAWGSYTCGDMADCSEECAELLQRALRAKSAPLVVEAQALRALSTLERGAAEEALPLARRASLAARSEGLPQPEFLAHLVLARTRRHMRQSHLSLRILEALRAVVTEPWRGFLAWEWLMAGGDVSVAETDLASFSQAPARQNGLALLLLLRGAASGDATLVTRARRELRSDEMFFPAAKDARTLIAASDPDVEAPDPQMVAWRAGRDPLIPAALHGLRLRSDEREPTDTSESAAAYAVRFPDGRSVRVLHWGLEQLHLPGAFRVPQSHRAKGRMETVLSVLALGEGGEIAESECFAQTYGFAFVSELHRGVFDVLLHRARAALGSKARLVRDGDRLRLECDQPLIIPDPRVAQRVSDRVLRLLSERGSASAKDMANQLGISLRAAQNALSLLSEQGACETQKRGRAVAYVVEDTAFSEPTLRFRAEQLTGLSIAIPSAKS